MKKIKTKFFGEVSIDEKKIIHFDVGIPAFEHLSKFLFMLDNDENSPFCWLQSIEDVDIAFTLFDIYSVMENYNPSLNTALLKTLGECEDKDLFLYCIAHIPRDIKKMSVNLKAPIVINTKTNKARQIICNNEEYSIKHYIYDNDKKVGE